MNSDYFLSISLCLSLFLLFFFLPLLVFLIDMFMFMVFFFFFFFFFFFVNKFNFMVSLSYSLGCDNVSFMFICLSFWICLMMVFSMILYCYSYLGKNFLLYLNFMFFSLLFLFVVSNFFYFFFFFECSLIPVFLIIFGWGYQPERLSAGFFLILYTMVGSLPFFLSILYLDMIFGNFFFFLNFKINNMYLIFFIIMSFMIKFPLFGFHLWLPSAHVESPVSGSMILAGVMLKLGGYGFFRFLGFMYFYVFYYGYLFFSLSLFGCLFISCYCLIQSDLKVLVAYSSICHMGMIIMGLFTLSYWCVLGGLIFMLGHGFISSGLFYFVGLLFNRSGSRSFFVLSGLLSISPSSVMFLFFFCISNMSCPPTINLFSEILIVLGSLNWSFYSLFFFFFILFFSAIYSLMIYYFISHGIICDLIKMFSCFYLLEYLVMFFHLFPVFFMILCFDFFI
uniref:NADH dehydrogenase subunit 4 n=1 Tax=Rhotana formosana TaxID=3081105 RepID=UPI002A8165E6|nr:NADH dehydrogenase subunit 4 [Rhotana formosana]WOW99134.1 NADH dehydrogenase subunit 4 [Rhotana formosana]